MKTLEDLAVSSSDFAKKTIKSLAIAALPTLVLFASGCSLCCNPLVDNYTTFGSRTPRTDMQHGRVGSVFSDPQGAPGIVVQHLESEQDGMDYESHPVQYDGEQYDGEQYERDSILVESADTSESF